MAYLELRIMEGGQEPYIQFYVDGVDLGARIEEALGEAGFDNCLPWYGGDYSIAETVLGDKARTLGAEAAILLACGCGQFACSGVVADVRVTGATITFSGFSTWFRGERTTALLDPLVFDRAQYGEAVDRLHSMIETWQAPPVVAPTQSSVKAIPLGPPDGAANAP